MMRELLRAAVNKKSLKNMTRCRYISMRGKINNDVRTNLTLRAQIGITFLALSEIYRQKPTSERVVLLLSKQNYV